MSATQQFLDRLSPHLLWDVDRGTIDTESHAAFLICRIMERGSSEDVRMAWDFYGENRVREALMDAPSLSRKTICFFAHQFRITKESFRSYQRGKHWVQ